MGTLGVTVLSYEAANSYLLLSYRLSVCEILKMGVSQFLVVQNKD